MRGFAFVFLAALQLGSIDFPNGGKPEAQAAFLRGVLLLHNFAYPQAAAAFDEAQKSDPNFVLAYWGEAMTRNHPIWYETDPAAAKAVLARIPAAALRAATPRERAYVEAAEILFGDGAKGERDTGYERAMERLADANPGDVEAQVFHALAILGTKARDERDARKAIRAAAILEPLLPAHPDHPGVLHYLIHAYDDPIHAPLGLRAARRYAGVASAAPHALHMPSHIFLQLGMWNEAAKSNEAAYALSKEWVARDLHSLEWLQYVYLQQRRNADAKKLLDELTSGESDRQKHARVNMTVRYAVETGDWEAFDFAKEHDMPAIFFARGMQAIARKKLEDADADVAALAHSTANADQAMRCELEALLAGARGNAAEERRLLDLAIVHEERLGAPSGPPDVFKPAHELLAERLLARGNAKGAAAEFREALLRTPNRAASVEGLRRAEGGAQ